MIVTSLVSFFVNEVVSKALFGGKKDFDFEAPLTHLVWITSAVSIAVTFIASKLLLGDFTDANGVAHAKSLVGAVGHHQLRHRGRRVDPGVHQNFRQHQFAPRPEVTNCSKHGGASLNILSGLRGRQFLRVLDGPGASWC